MGESVAVAKEADAKKSSSSTRSSSKSIHRVQNENEMQLGTLGGFIGNIGSNGGRPSVEGIATQLSGMLTGERAPVLSALQQTHGNRYVQRVVSGIQAKLVVGQPGDKYEQEADRVADAVVRMPEPHGTYNGSSPRIIPRKEITPTKSEGQTPQVTSSIESKINSLKSGGQPLSIETRNFFEPRFGSDFSGVRIHNDVGAAKAAQSLVAKAFTVGKHIVFAPGQFAPQTVSGRHLLAHELSHVIQQKGSFRSGTIQRVRADHPYQDIVTFDRIDRRPRIDERGTIHHGIEVHIPREINGTPVNVDTAIACLQAALRRDIRRARVSGLIGAEDTLRSSVQQALESRRSQDVINIIVRYQRQPEGRYSVSALQVEESPPMPLPEPEPGPEPGRRPDIEPPEDDTTERGRRLRSRQPPSAQRRGVGRAIRGPVCGPDVTAQITTALINVHSTFVGLPTRALKQGACNSLDSLLTGFFAWDIINLHYNAWIQNYRPTCATAGATPPCGSSVQVGSECYYAGSVNYVVFGVMCKLCYDHYRSTSNPQGVNRFTKSKMLRLINYYKGTGFSGLATPAANFAESQQWAAAGYDGWPSGSTPPAGDRSNCSPVCPTRYFGTAFRVNWYPHRI